MTAVDDFGFCRGQILLVNTISHAIFQFFYFLLSLTPVYVYDITMYCIPYEYTAVDYCTI